MTPPATGRSGGSRSARGGCRGGSLARGGGCPASRERSRAVRARSAARSSSKHQDAQRRGQRVTLVEQFPDPGGQGKLPTQSRRPPARPRRGHRARGIKRSQVTPAARQGPRQPGQWCRPGSPGRPDRRAVRSRGTSWPSAPNFQRLLTVSSSLHYIKSVSVIGLATLPQVSRSVIGMDLAIREADTTFATRSALTRSGFARNLTRWSRSPSASRPRRPVPRRPGSPRPGVGARLRAAAGVLPGPPHPRAGPGHRRQRSPPA